MQFRLSLLGVIKGGMSIRWFDKPRKTTAAWCAFRAGKSEWNRRKELNGKIRISSSLKWTNAHWRRCEINKDTLFVIVFIFHSPIYNIHMLNVILIILSEWNIIFYVNFEKCMVTSFPFKGNCHWFHVLLYL